MKREQKLFIIQVYVDDIIFEATSEYIGEEFFTLMGNTIYMSMMGELNFFLGLQIWQTSTRTSIFKKKYTNELLKKFLMVDPKHIDTPKDTKSKKGEDEIDPLLNLTMYRDITGSLLYITTS